MSWKQYQKQRLSTRLTVEHDNGRSETETQKKSTLFSKTNCITTVMQVVKTSVNNRDVYVNVMFDSGSDRSFIREGCVKSLGLECVDKEVVSLACFGDKNPQRKADLKSVFELEVQGNRVKLIGIEYICPSLHR